MISQQLLSILVCPDTRTPLAVADEALLGEVNRAIAAGRISNRGGDVLAEPIQAALVCQDGLWLYPIVDGIPVMLVDAAIDVSQIRKVAPPPRNE